MNEDYTKVSTVDELINYLMKQKEIDSDFGNQPLSVSIGDNASMFTLSGISGTTIKAIKENKISHKFWVICENRKIECTGYEDMHEKAFEIGFEILRKAKSSSKNPFNLISPVRCTKDEENNTLDHFLVVHDIVKEHHKARLRRMLYWG